MKLKELRARRGLTQFDLKIKTNIHQTKISHFERGYLQPTQNELCRLAEALKVRPERITFNSKKVC